MNSDFEIQQAIETERARLDSESYIMKSLRAVAYWCRCAFARLLLISIGIGFAALAFWCISYSIALFNKPIASFTLANLAQLAFALLGAFITGSCALTTIFTPPFVKQTQDARIATAIREKLQQQEADAIEVANLQSKATKWYRYGSFVGLLFDASLAKRYKWLPYIAVLIGYLLLGLITIIIAS